MATTFSWATPAALSSVIAGTALNALANSTCKLGAAITVSQNSPLFTKMVLNATYQANITASTTVGKGWFIESDGAGNYDQTGSAHDGTTNAPARAPDFIFIWPNKASTLGPAMLVSVPSLVRRPTADFKMLYQNTSGQAHTASNTDSTLQEQTQNEYGA